MAEMAGMAEVEAKNTQNGSFSPYSRHSRHPLWRELAEFNSSRINKLSTSAIPSCRVCPSMIFKAKNRIR